MAKFDPSLKERTRAKKRMKKPERHVLATTTVDVFRLFKVRDMGGILAAHSDGMVRTIGGRLQTEASRMLRPYIDEQNSIEVKG